MKPYPLISLLSAAAVALCCASPATALESSRIAQPGGVAALNARLELAAPAGTAPALTAYTEAGPDGPTLVLLMLDRQGAIGDVISVPLAALDWREVR